MYVMPLDYEGLETRLGQRVGREDDLYNNKEIQDYNCPNVGTNEMIQRARLFKITMSEGGELRD